MHELPAFVGVVEFVRLSGLSGFEVRKRLRAGTLPHIRAGQNYLVNVEAALEVLNAESRGEMTKREIQADKA